MQTIIEKAKAEFFKMVDEYGPDVFHLLSHVPEAEKWVRHMHRQYPESDEEILLLSVWLHDIGHYPLPSDLDHAVRGEQRARDFLLRESYPPEKMEAVLHCVRAHRNRDVLPETLEARIITFADSASHMTDAMYFNMAKDDKESGTDFRVYAKMERDFNDLSAFPEVKAELLGLYEAWREWLRKYERLDF